MRSSGSICCTNTDRFIVPLWKKKKGFLHIISMRIRRILSFKIIRPCLCFTFHFFDVKMPYLTAGLSFLEFLCSNICSLKKVNHKNIYSIYENEFLSSSFTYHSVRLHFLIYEVKLWTLYLITAHIFTIKKPKVKSKQAMRVYVFFLEDWRCLIVTGREGKKNQIRVLGRTGFIYLQL